MDLLEEILRRQAGTEFVPPAAVAPEYDINDPYGIPTATRKAKFPELDPRAKPALKPPLAEWGPYAGLLTPGIGGLGNMNPAVTTAPVGPEDPNYADPKTSPSVFLTPSERSMQAMVNPAALDSPRPPMPVARPREADGAVIDDGTPTDVSSANRQPVAATPAYQPPGVASPATAPVASAEEPSMFGRLGGSIMNGLKNNSATLLALGAGFAGAPNIGQGISRAAAAALPATQVDLKNRTSLQSQSAAYQAMIAAKVPPNLALAALTNPEIMKSVTANYLGDRKAEIKVVKDSLNNERLVAVNPYDLTSKDITASGEGGAATGVAAAAQLEPKYDPVTGRDEAFLQSLDPLTQSTVKSIADGKAGTTGRNLQKYLPYVARYENGFDQARYNERNKFHTELGSTSPSTAGGQITLIPTALGHLADVAEHMAKLQNVNGLGIAKVGHAVNAVANQTTGNAATANALNDAVAKFSGEVGKIYSGSQGGGVHEREETRARLGPNLTAAEQIEALKTSRDLLQSKIDAVQARADAVLGQGHKVDAVGKVGRDAIERIDRAIAVLSGEKKPTAAAPRAKGIVNGLNWSVN